MTNELALLVHWSVRLKLNRVSLVQFSYVDLFAPLAVYSVAHSVCEHKAFNATGISAGFIKPTC